MMGRPRAQWPTPGKRLRRGRWRVYWWHDGHVYEVPVGSVDEVEAEARRLDVALALCRGEWPAWARGLAAVERYLALASGEVEADALLEEYQRSRAGQVSPVTLGSAMAQLRELAAWAGKPLAGVTAADADAFLAHVLRTPGPFQRRRPPRGANTRNKILLACRRFYRWAMATGRLSLARNPFADCERIPEVVPGEIVYCTRAERDRLLAAADGLADGVGVWLAFWAGLRRGEVQRCAWEHIEWERGRLVVPRAKTGRPRVVPLAARLRQHMEGERRRRGRIVPWPDGLGAWTARAQRLVVELAGRCPEVPRPRVGWNAWRHTFGSLLVQEGVSLDKVAAWLGNSPGVCRRHYAVFVPRDRRDGEIDRLE